MTDYSRYLFCQGITDAAGRLFLTDRVPFRFVERSDNRTHVVTEGDDLFGLADRYFTGLPRPSQFFWLLADFQPEPIFDPTLRLAIGRQLVIPSVRMVVEEILNESRRPDFLG